MNTPAPPGTFTGVLHVQVAFDWGDEVDLTLARARQGTVPQPLPRRRRTPSTIEYRPLPVRLAVPSVSLRLPELGTVEAAGDATIFDFAGVSVALRVPFTLPAGALLVLAGELADPEPVVRATRAALEPLYQELLPGITDPHFSPLTEEYFVFQLPSGDPLAPATLLKDHPAWLAGLVRLEAGPLSAEEINEALRRHLSYSPSDLFVADWAAAVLLDSDCEETLQAIEFANLQLLEYRHIDNRLDDYLATADDLVRPRRPRRWFPAWRTHLGPLQVVGELQVEATGLFERTGNVLKLVGDQYLARLYRMLALRFHLPQWEQNIQRKLEVLERIYEMLSDQAATIRGEALEITVVILIMLELALAIWRH